jgi:hypothetical protein
MADKKPANFDNIIEKIKPFGCYQWRHIIITGVAAMPVGAFNLANVFFAAVPQYHCEDLTKTEEEIHSVTGVLNLNNNSKEYEEVCYEDRNYDSSCSRWIFDESVYGNTIVNEVSA